eukprot:5699985-Karenia_brevis.AAC.1
MKQKRFTRTSGPGDDQVRQWTEPLPRLSCDILMVLKSTDIKTVHVLLRTPLCPMFTTIGPA